MRKEKQIVVTGAAGFIGSALVRHLNSKGKHNIVVVDDLRTGDKWKNLVGKKFSEIVSKNRLFDWLAGRDSEICAFIHLGACSNTVEKDADYLLDNNFRYTKRLAEYALRHGHRFIYASSAATYGNGLKGFRDDGDAFEELEPLNMYGYSKHLFDLWAKREGVLDRLVGLKYFNVFGPNEWHKGRMASVILNWLPQVQKGRGVNLFRSSEPEKFGDGEQCRDFIYVKDVVRMTCAFLDNQAGGIFNIGTGVANSWNHLVKSLYKAVGMRPNITYVDMPADLIDKYQNYTCADMKKTQNILGKIAQCGSFEEDVIEYVQQFLLPEKRW